MAYPFDKFRHFMVWNFKNTIVDPQGFQLLLFEWNSRWQWRNMPMDVAIPLLTSQGQDVDTLCADRTADGLSHVVDRALQAQIFIHCKIARYLFLVLNRRDQGIPI